MTRIVDIRTSRLSNFLAFQNDPLGFLVSLLKEGDVVSLRTSRKRPSYIVNSPEIVQEILVTKEASFRKGRSSNVLRRTIGDGLLTSEREDHKRQKKYMQPAFYKERIQAYASAVREESARLGEQLRHGQTIPMHEAMMQLTLSIITRTMFATDVEETKSELAAAVDDTIERTARTLFSPLILPLGFPTSGNRIHRQAIRTLEEMVLASIREAKRNPDPYRMSMLGMLLDTRDDHGAALDETEIRDQMMTMLLAGHETTANLLTWIWYVLDRTPEVEKRWTAELSDVEGKNMDHYERYRALSYTQQIIQEALRLYPPAWIILREAEQEVSLLEDDYPARSSFLISPFVMHRNADMFADPLTFRPERFAPGEPLPPRFAYFPFGGGSRSCIGSHFAMMEATLILYELGRRFRFRNVSSLEATPEPLVSLRMKGGLTVRAERRA